MFPYSQGEAEPFAGSFASQLIMSAAALALSALLTSSAPAAPADVAPPARVAIVAACTAAAPADGQSVAGPVLQVIDGQTLCIAKGPTPDQWVRVRLTDVYDREDRGSLMAAAFAKDVVCSVERRDAQGASGRCTLEGAPLGQVIGSDAAKLQAASWR